MPAPFALSSTRGVAERRHVTTARCPLSTPTFAWAARRLSHDEQTWHVRAPRRLREGCAMVGDGDKAPDFELPTDGGEPVKLSRLKGKAAVLYFYPKDDTSGCTAEAKDFSTL